MDMEDSRSPSRGGTYELYENQKTLLPAAEGRGRASPAIAPGCPGSPQDMQQMVEELRKEVGELKSREDNLLQIISDLRDSKTNKVPSGSFGDGPLTNAEGASGSPIHESQEEKLKDAHITHLQRQVTILQASVFKADGWATRFEIARKERDQSIDDYRNACVELHQCREQKEALERHASDLSGNIAELQNWLQQARRDLEVERQHERCQATVNSLKEELNSVRAERTTFKESMNRLSYENEQLKGAAEASKQSLGTNAAQSNSELSSNTLPPVNSSLGAGGRSSPPCTQELDYLHRVVDTLKHTVLEQRNFLLSMRAPQSHLPPPSPLRSANGVVAPADTSVAESSSADQITVLSNPKSSIALTTEQAHFVAGSPTPGATHSATAGSRLIKPTGQQGRSISPVNQGGHQNGGIGVVDPGEEFAVAMATATSSGISSANPGRIGGGDVQPRIVYAPPRRPAPNVPNIPSPQMVRQGSPQLRPVVFMGNVKQPLQLQNSAPALRKISSEVHTRRPLSDTTPAPGKAKSDVIYRQAERPTADGKVYPQWMFAGPTGDRLSPQHRGASPVLAHFQTATPASTVCDGSRGVHYEASQALPTAGQYVLTSDVRRGPSSPSHQRQNPPVPYSTAMTTFALQQHPQPQGRQYVDSSGLHPTPIQTYNMMGGGRVVQGNEASATTTTTTTTSAKLVNPNTRNPNPPHPAPGSAWRDVHTSPRANLFPTNNNSSAACIEAAGSSVDQDQDQHSPAHLNADRLCPVCNRNFGQLSMEEFQTHVFECFDDENAPETMKAPEAVDSSSSQTSEADRFCPMCNTRFGKGTQQAEYEKHVHGHFGEELPGENFEILNP